MNKNRLDSEGICIAYPYVFPQDTDLPIDYSIPAHCTLIYLGYTAEVDFTPDDVLNSIRGLDFGDLGIVDVDGLALFGTESEVLVMKLKSSHLVDNFELVRDRLAEKGIQNASSFPDYMPHITLNNDYHGPTIGYTLPTTVGLGRPQLWWGEEIHMDVA